MFMTSFEVLVTVSDLVLKCNDFSCVMMCFMMGLSISFTNLLFVTMGLTFCSNLTSELSSMKKNCIAGFCGVRCISGACYGSLCTRDILFDARDI